MGLGSPSLRSDTTTPTSSTVGWKFSTDVLLVLAADFGGMAITFVVHPLVARALGADGLGLYSLCLTVSGFALLAGNLGLAHALTRFLAEQHRTQQAQRQFAFAGLAWSALIGAVAACVLMLIRKYLASAFEMPQLNALLLILALSFPFASVFMSLQGLFNGRRTMRQFATFAVLHRVLNAVFVLGFVHAGLGIRGAVTGIVLTEVSLSILGVWVARRHIALKLRAIRDDAQALLGFGAPMCGANAVNAVMNYTDILMVGFFMSAADVGYYSAAAVLAALLSKLPGAIQRIAFPAAAAHSSTGDSAALLRLVHASTRVATAVVIPVGLALAFFGRDILLLLFGPDFRVAATPLLILLIARVVRGSTIVPIGNTLPAMGRPDINFKIEGATAILNVVLNALLIPRFGIAGAAAATTTALLVGAAAGLFALKAVAGIELSSAFYARAFGAAAVLLAVFLVGENLANHFALGCALTVGALGFSYFILLLRVDRAAIARSIKHLATKDSSCRG